MKNKQLSFINTNDTIIAFKSNEIDYNSFQIDGIDHKDYPDFCDAYICYGEYIDGIELSDNDYEELNNDGDLVHELVYKQLF